LAKLVVYQQPTCLCVKMEFVTGVGGGSTTATPKVLI